MTSQRPHTVVLSCSDSRVPVESVFDQHIGDLFVVRVAGNLVGSSQIASVEFAVSQFESPLVVVLGHSACGAVRATLDQLSTGGSMPSAHLEQVVKSIQPAVEPLLKDAAGADAAALEQQAIRANVMHSVQELIAQSPLLAGVVEQGNLTVIGAEYDLPTGHVDFFAGVPTAWSGGASRGAPGA